MHVPPVVIRKLTPLGANNSKKESVLNPAKDLLAG